MILGYVAFYAFGGILLVSGIGAALLAHALRLRLVTPVAAVYACAGAAVLYFVATLGPVGLLKLGGFL